MAISPYTNIMVNAQYNVTAPGSFAARIALIQRRRMFGRFLTVCSPDASDTILDVGVTSDRSFDHSNYLEAWYPHKARITAVGTDDASFLEVAYPGLNFLRADGRKLPLDDNSFDYVHSSAVLEHVGARRQQADFLGEMWRVSRKGIFATTPNRWFPVEFHTILPLIHWLPPNVFRSTLRMMGRNFFADENNLNLIGARSLGELARIAGLHNFRIETVSLAAWPTNLILVAYKSKLTE